MTPVLLLSSASPRRRELLEMLGVPFEVIPSRYEEPSPGVHSDPREWAVTMARHKTTDVAGANPGRLVVGADTIVVLGERIFGKPADAADAARMLRELSDREHRVVTGVAILDDRGATPETYTLAVETGVTFRALDDREIEAYVATGEPLDKAGAYGIQGRGGLFITGIHGDYYNVVGLPIAPLALLLRALGVSVLGVPEK